MSATGDDILARTGGKYVEPGGEFTRDQRYIATRITADGRNGWPVENWAVK